MGKCELLNVLAQLSCIIPEHIAHTPCSQAMCSTCKHEAKRCEMMQPGWHTINSIHFPVSVYGDARVCARCLCYITRETSLLLFDLCILNQQSGWLVAKVCYSNRHQSTGTSHKMHVTCSC